MSPSLFVFRARRWRNDPASTVVGPGAERRANAMDCKKPGQNANFGEWRAHSGPSRLYLRCITDNIVFPKIFSNFFSKNPKVPEIGVVK